MTVNILLNDLYLDFTYSKEVSIERRFFVEIEIEKEKKDVLVFMSEINSTFVKYQKLNNIILLETKNLKDEYSTKNEDEEKHQSYKEFLIIDKSVIHDSLKNVIENKLNSLNENDWLNFCEKRYFLHKVELTAELKIKEKNKFHKANEVITKLWTSFPENINEFQVGGDMEKSESIPFRFDKFLKEIQYYYLENKLPEHGLKEKKFKI